MANYKDIETICQGYTHLINTPEKFCVAVEREFDLKNRSSLSANNITDIVIPFVSVYYSLVFGHLVPEIKTK